MKLFNNNIRRPNMLNWLLHISELKVMVSKMENMLLLNGMGSMQNMWIRVSVDLNFGFVQFGQI